MNNMKKRIMSSTCLLFSICSFAHSSSSIVVYVIRLIQGRCTKIPIVAPPRAIRLSLTGKRIARYSSECTHLHCRRAFNDRCNVLLLRHGCNCGRGRMRKKPPSDLSNEITGGEKTSQYPNVE